MGAGALPQARDPQGALSAIGVVVALPGEARTLLPRQGGEGRPRPLPAGGWLCRAGIGAGRARIAAERLLATGVTALVSWGSAGALDPVCAAGDLLLPAHVSAPDQPPLAVDGDWQARLQQRIAASLVVHTGLLIQSPVVLTTPAAKQALRRASGAIAVDMESAAVAAVARRAGVPFIAVRAVADAAGATVPAAALVTLTPSGRLQPGLLLQALLTRPGDWPALIRLGRDFRAAQHTLRQVWRLAGPTLGAVGYNNVSVTEPVG